MSKLTILRKNKFSEKDKTPQKSILLELTILRKGRFPENSVLRKAPFPSNRLTRTAKLIKIDYQRISSSRKYRFSEKVDHVTIVMPEGLNSQ